MLVPVLFGGRMAHSESRSPRSVDVYGTLMHPNGLYSKPSKMIRASFDSGMALRMSHLCSFLRFMAEGWLMWRTKQSGREAFQGLIGSSREPITLALGFLGYLMALPVSTSRGVNGSHNEPNHN